MRKLIFLLVGLLLACNLSSSKEKLPSNKERIATLELKLSNLQAAFLEMHNEDINQLYARTSELNERLKRVEQNVRALVPAQLNALDARVAELERPEPEDEDK